MIFCLVSHFLKLKSISLSVHLFTLRSLELLNKVKGVRNFFQAYISLLFLKSFYSPIIVIDFKGNLDFENHVG